MRKTTFAIVFISALLVTMCRGYEEPVSTIPGLICRPYTDYFQSGLDTSKGLECYYTCPDGTVAGPFDSQADPSLSGTKGDLDRQLCDIAPQPITPTASSAALSPTSAPSATLAASPTVEAVATETIPATVESTLTAGISVTGGESAILTGKVLMCDLGANLINFRIVQPSPDLTGKTLTAQIADMESMCYVNPTNPSLLTCALPAGVTFPARIVASVDGVAVNDFTYSGIGCEILTTAVPTTTP
jgi:hypothetical protein